MGLGVYPRLIHSSKGLVHQVSETLSWHKQDRWREEMHQRPMPALFVHGDVLLDLQTFIFILCLVKKQMGKNCFEARCEGGGKRVCFKGRHH